MTNREALNNLENKQFISFLQPLRCPPHTVCDGKCIPCMDKWLNEEYKGDFTEYEELKTTVGTTTKV